MWAARTGGSSLGATYLLCQVRGRGSWITSPAKHSKCHPNCKIRRSPATFMLAAETALRGVWGSRGLSLQGNGAKPSTLAWMHTKNPRSIKVSTVYSDWQRLSEVSGYSRHLLPDLFRWRYRVLNLRPYSRCADAWPLSHSASSNRLPSRAWFHLASFCVVRRGSEKA